MPPENYDLREKLVSYQKAFKIEKDIKKAEEEIDEFAKDYKHVR